MFKGVLDEVRRSVGPAPRTYSFWQWRTERMKRPWWCHGEDPLDAVFFYQKSLITRGDVVWGAIVQANEVLYRPGAGDSAANMVYSLAPESFDDPMPLLEVAANLFQVKGDAPGDELQTFADNLADERVRLMKEAVPRAVSPHYPCTFTAAVVKRRQLPGGVLTGPLMPIFVLPELTSATLIVPHWHWPARFRDWWVSP